MKKTRLSLILLTLAIMTLLNSALLGNTLAAGPIKVVVNGETVVFEDVQPFADTNGRTLVPVRFVSEQLGCNLSWDNETKTATIYRGLIKVELTAEQKDITVLGVKKTMDTAAQILNGRTLVPVRFVAEAFGCEVVWDSLSRTVLISNPDKNIYKIGDFDIVIDEDDGLSVNTAGGLVVVKQTGLILGEGKYNGKPVLRISIITDDPIGDIQKRRVEAEALLKQRISFIVVDAVMAHAANLKGFSDDLEIKSWADSKYDVSAGGGRGVINIMVYMF